MPIRHTLFRRGAPALLCGMSLAFAGCSFVSEHLEHETRTMHVEHVPASALKVRTENGHVEAQGAPGSVTSAQVTIQAELRARTVERLAQTRIMATRDESGLLFIRVEWPDGGRLGSEGCDLDIHIPDARGIDIQTSNSALRIENLAGSALLHTSNGNIAVKSQAGAVDARTSNGSVQLSGIAGDAGAESSNGNITIDAAGGPVRAKTSNGSITLQLQDDSPGPVALRTSNGNVTFIPGKAFRGPLGMSTSNGGVHMNSVPSVRTVSMSKKAASVIVGENGEQAPESSIQTSNGTIKVEFREQ